MPEVATITEDGLLARIAYAYFPSSTPDEDQITIALGPQGLVLAPSQIDDFLANYDILYHLPNQPSGFSATVFREKLTGQLTIAVRGSEDAPESVAELLTLFDPDTQAFADWLTTNAGFVARDGIAVDQVIDLYNFMLQLRATAGQEVLQYSFEAPILNAGRLYEVTVSPQTATGLGILVADQSVDVVGHSLGGHLAIAASRLMPDVIESVTAFNPMGFDPATIYVPNPPGALPGFGIGAEGFFQALHDLEVSTLGSSGIALEGFNDEIITNIVVKNDFVSQLLVPYVGADLPGTQIQSFSVLEADGRVPAHYIDGLHQSLQVMSLFTTLDSTVSLDEAGAILKHSSRGDELTQPVRALAEQDCTWMFATTSRWTHTASQLVQDEARL